MEFKEVALHPFAGGGESEIGGVGRTNTTGREAKVKLEEEILGRGGTPRRRNSSRGMNEGGGTGGGGAAGMDDSSHGNNLLLLDNGGGPLGLTDLYT